MGWALAPSPSALGVGDGIVERQLRTFRPGGSQPGGSELLAYVRQVGVMARLADGEAGVADDVAHRLGGTEEPGRLLEPLLVGDCAGEGFEDVARVRQEALVLRDLEGFMEAVLGPVGLPVQSGERTVRAEGLNEGRAEISDPGSGERVLRALASFVRPRPGQLDVSPERRV